MLGRCTEAYSVEKGVLPCLLELDEMKNEKRQSIPKESADETRLQTKGPQQNFINEIKFTQTQNRLANRNYITHHTPSTQLKTQNSNKPSAVFKNKSALVIFRQQWSRHAEFAKIVLS